MKRSDIEGRVSEVIRHRREGEGLFVGTKVVGALIQKTRHRRGVERLCLGTLFGNVMEIVFLETKQK